MAVDWRSVIRESLVHCREIFTGRDVLKAIREKNIVDEDVREEYSSFYSSVSSAVGKHVKTIGAEVYDTVNNRKFYRKTDKYAEPTAIYGIPPTDDFKVGMSEDLFNELKVTGNLPKSLDELDKVVKEKRKERAMSERKSPAEPESSYDAESSPDEDTAEDKQEYAEDMGEAPESTVSTEQSTEPDDAPTEQEDDSEDDVDEKVVRADESVSDMQEDSADAPEESGEKTDDKESEEPLAYICEHRLHVPDKVAQEIDFRFAEVMSVLQTAVFLFGTLILVLAVKVGIDIYVLLSS